MMCTTNLLKITGYTKDVEKFLETIPFHRGRFPLSRVLSGSDKDGTCWSDPCSMKRGCPANNPDMLSVEIVFGTIRTAPAFIIAEAAILYGFSHVELYCESDNGHFMELFSKDGEVTSSEWRPLGESENAEKH